jgi:flavin-dependent dehydrogenase
VRLIDRAAFPRNKPCGGGISARVLRRFPYLGAALPRIATHAIRRLYLEGPCGESTVIESDEPAALMIRRVEFDALLVSLAVEKGAELVTGVDIVAARMENGRVALAARDGRHFDADTIVAADGVYSVVARRLGLNPGWPAASVALDMMEETPRADLRDLDPDTLWVAYGYTPTRLNAGHAGSACPRRRLGRRRMPEGYAYIFPKRDHVNVGVGFVLSYFRDTVDAAPYDVQRGLVERLRTRGIVEGESVRRNFTPSMIPVGGPLREPGRGRVLLAGDAGGFVNAFTAEGIYYAMVSGELAARAIIDGAPDASLADRYRRAVNDEIGHELRDSVLIQRYLFADDRRIARAVRGARREQGTTRLIVDLATGRRSYRAVRRRILTRSPWLAGRMLLEYLQGKPRIAD